MQEENKGSGKEWGTKQRENENSLEPKHYETNLFRNIN